MVPRSLVETRITSRRLTPLRATMPCHRPSSPSTTGRAGGKPRRSVSGIFPTCVKKPDQCCSASTHSPSYEICAGWMVNARRPSVTRDAGERSLAPPLVHAFHFTAQRAVLTFADGDDQGHRANWRLEHAVPVAHNLDLCLGGHGNSQQRKSAMQPSVSVS